VPFAARSDPRRAAFGTIQGHALSVKKGDVEAGVFLGPRHRTRQLDVDDALAKMTDANELREKLMQYTRT
jgi:hypothetical protein